MKSKLPNPRTLLCLLLFLCGTARALEVTKLRNTGNDKNRINLVFLGDGFTSSEITSLYAPWVDKVSGYFFNDSTMSYVYYRYRNFITPYRVDMPVAKSGLGWGTPLNAQLTCVDYTVGQCYVDWALANAMLDSAMKPLGIKATWRVIALNGSHRSAAHYAKGGNLVTTFIVGDGNAPWTTYHEGGHAWHYLGDEYSEGFGKYAGGEAGLNFWANLTADSTGKKWARWIGYTSPVPGLGTVGAYNGGMQYDSGVYRPTYASMMGFRGQFMPPHNIVAMEKMIQDIYAQVDPVDSFLPTSATLTNPDSIWLRLVDPKVTKVDWSINGKAVDTMAGGTLRLRNYFLASGDYKVRAIVYDEVVRHAFSNNKSPDKLDLVRQGLDKLQKVYEWNVRLAPLKPDTVTVFVPRVDTLLISRVDTMRTTLVDTVRTTRVDTLYLTKRHVYQIKVSAMFDSLVVPEISNVQ